MLLINRVAQPVQVQSPTTEEVKQELDCKDQQIRLITPLLGLTYTTPGGVKFDIAGLTNGSDNWGITLGLTYALPIFGK
ncbi:MAG: hypothetical protein ACE5JQ_15565 [Candidatus Methylomirabilales bacterium]